MPQTAPIERAPESSDHVVADGWPSYLMTAFRGDECGIEVGTLGSRLPEYNSSPTARIFLPAGCTVAAEEFMRERGLTMPEIAVIGGTRAALGAGIGLLISDRLNKDQRKGAGWALLGIGVFSTVPIVIGILTKRPISEKPVAVIA